MLKAILLDFDGTIAETERLGHRVAYNAAFAQLGLGWNWTDALYGELLAVSGGKERIAHYIDRYNPPAVPLMTEPTFIPMVHERKQQIFSTLAAGIKIRPGVGRLISEARDAGVLVAIATTAARAGVDAIIGPNDVLRDAFTFVAAGDDVAAKKPAPDIYLYALAALGTEARDCIALEDSAIGTRAAIAAGIRTLVTVSDYTRDEDFSGAAAVLSSLGEPHAPAQTLAGVGPANGAVDLAYLRALLAS